MANCEKCGRSGMGLLHSAIKFKDKKYICVKCLKELGHAHPIKDASILSLSTSEDILHPEIKWQREQADAIDRRSTRIGISPAQYSALEQANATEFEFKIFARICALLGDEGVKSDELVISPGENGSLLVMKNGIVLIEFKGEPDIKWIRLSDDPDNKIRFGQVGRLNGLADRIVNMVANG